MVRQDTLDLCLQLLVFLGGLFLRKQRLAGMLKFRKFASVQPETVACRAAFDKNILGEIGVGEAGQLRSVYRQTCTLFSTGVQEDKI